LKSRHLKRVESLDERAFKGILAPPKPKTFFVTGDRVSVCHAMSKLLTDKYPNPELLVAPSDLLEGAEIETEFEATVANNSLSISLGEGEFTFSPIVLPPLSATAYFVVYKRRDPLSSVYDFQSYEVSFATEPSDVDATFSSDSRVLLLSASQYRHVDRIAIRSYSSIIHTGATKASKVDDETNDQDSVSEHVMVSPVTPLCTALGSRAPVATVATLYDAVKLSPFFFAKETWRNIAAAMAPLSDAETKELVPFLDPIGEHALLALISRARSQ
jgi:hypothetical protein